MFLSTEELKTHLYGENVDVITREDDEITTAAIDGAIAEVKGYLSAYDVTSVFAATGSSRNALLLIFVKDIAVWHLLNLSNPGYDLELREKRYNSAVAWLKGVQRGDISPDLPKVTTSDENPGTITYGSNPKRNNHF